MCCLTAIAFIFGPRIGIILWWLFDMSRWERTFSSVIFPVLGFLFLPWTTLAYVLVSPGGIEGLDWVFIILAVLFDIGAFSGGYRNRGRFNRRW